MTGEERRRRLDAALKSSTPLSGSDTGGTDDRRSRLRAALNDSAPLGTQKAEQTAAPSSPDRSGVSAESRYASPQKATDYLSARERLGQTSMDIFSDQKDRTASDVRASLNKNENLYFDTVGELSTLSERSARSGQAGKQNNERRIAL